MVNIAGSGVGPVVCEYTSSPVIPSSTAVEPTAASRRQSSQRGLDASEDWSPLEASGSSASRSFSPVTMSKARTVTLLAASAGRSIR